MIVKLDITVLSSENAQIATESFLIDSFKLRDRVALGHVDSELSYCFHEMQYLLRAINGELSDMPDGARSHSIFTYSDVANLLAPDEDMPPDMIFYEYIF